MGFLCAAVLLFASIISIVAGVLLWSGRRGGWGLTVVNQVVQSIGIYFPTLALQAGIGASVNGHLFFFQKATFGDSLFNETIGSSFMPNCIATIHPASALLPAYGISVNFLAIALAVFSIRHVRMANQSLEPTVLASTPRADARVAPAKIVAHH